METMKPRRLFLFKHKVQQVSKGKEEEGKSQCISKSLCAGSKDASDGVNSL